MNTWWNNTNPNPFQMQQPFQNIIYVPVPAGSWPPAANFNGQIPPNPYVNPDACANLTSRQLKKAKKFWDGVKKEAEGGTKKEEKKKFSFTLLETFMLCASSNLFILCLSFLWAIFKH